MRHRVGERLQLPVGRLQLRGAQRHPPLEVGVEPEDFLLGPDAPRDVLPDGQDAGDPAALVPDRRVAPRHPDELAVLLHVLVDDLPVIFGPRQNVRGERLEAPPPAFGFRDDRHDVAAQDLVSPIPEEPPAEFVAEGDPPGRVEFQDDAVGVFHQLAVIGLAPAQLFLGFFARGDDFEDGHEIFSLRTVYGQVEPGGQRGDVGFEGFGRSRPRHPVVDFEQLGIVFPYPRNHLAHFLPDDAGQPRLFFERPIDVKVDEIRGPPILIEHPAVGVPIVHVLEQGAVAAFALPEVRFGLEFGKGDGDIIGPAFPQGDAVRGEHVTAAVVELDEAEALPGEAERNEGDGFIPLPVAAVAGPGQALFLGARGEQAGGGAGPERSVLREERLGGIEPPLDHVAAHALVNRVPRFVADDAPVRVPGAEAVLRPDEFLSEPARLVIRVIVAVLEPDADGFAMRSPLKKPRDRLDELADVLAFVHEAEDFDRRFALALPLLELGDVLEDPAHLDDTAVLDHGPAHRSHPFVRPVRGGQFQLQVVRLGASHGAFDGPLDPLARLRGVEAHSQRDVRLPGRIQPVDAGNLVRPGPLTRGRVELPAAHLGRGAGIAEELVLEGEVPFRQVELPVEPLPPGEGEEQHTAPREPGEDDGDDDDERGPVLQVGEDLSRVDLGYHIPGRIGHGEHDGQHVDVPVIQALENALPAEHGLHRGDVRPRYSDPQVERGALPVPKLVQEDDVIPFPLHEERFRGRAGRGPGLDERVEVALGSDAENQRAENAAARE